MLNFVIPGIALCSHAYDSTKLQLSSDLNNMERGLQGLFTSKDAICSSKKKKYANYQARNEVRKHRIVADLLSKQERYLLCNANEDGEFTLLCFLESTQKMLKTKEKPLLGVM